MRKWIEINHAQNVVRIFVDGKMVFETSIGQWSFMLANAKSV